MRERAVITGIGCISCFGLGRTAYIDALSAGSSGVAPITAFDTSDCRPRRAATITGFDAEKFIPPIKLRRVDAAGRTAIVSARFLAEDAVGRSGAGLSEDAGIAIGTFSAGLDSTVEYLTGLTDRGPLGVPALLFSNTVSNAPASLCAIEFGLHGPNVTFNQREASSLAALAFSVGAIRDARTAVMISGGVDVVEETFFKVHDRFHALSPMRRGAPDSLEQEAARPFDRRRNGPILGEGAYLLLVEAGSAAERRGARVYGEILGIGASAAATAMNAWPDNPSGLVRAMRSALADAGLGPDDIGAVMAAANGSIQLDRIEAAAIDTVFGGRPLPVASVKGAVGEFGASGAAALTAGLLSIPDGRLVPTAGFREADPSCPASVRVSDRGQPVAGDTFLVNSAASGGTQYSVVVRTGGRS
jgi:3-oxoacyl-[acyl-carrier-protein] synthase II